MEAEAGKAKGSLAKDNAESYSPPMLHLTHEHLAKLGHKGPMPAVGSKVKISGLAHVGSVSENDDSMQEPGRAIGTGATTGKETRRSMTLHLHKMDIGKEGISEGEKDESQKAGAKAEIDKALKREMGGKKTARAEGAQAKNPAATPRGGGD